jgi:hypothetical protein
MTKKKIEYFGYLNGEKLNDLNLEKKLNYFISKKLFTATKVLQLTSNTAVNLLDSTNYKIVHEPVKELLEAYYCFITHNFQEHINTVLIDFFHIFNNQLIGLKKKEAKMVARLHFLTLINNTNSPNFDIVRMSEGLNGIPNVDNASKIELYTIKKEALKHQLVNENEKGLDEFLMGNSDYFSNQLISENSIFQEIIKFESDLKILLSLNEKYKFEKFEISLVSVSDGQNPAKYKTQPISDKWKEGLTMPTEKEMDDYLIRYVFSR